MDYHKDYYSILLVPSAASPEDLKSSYRRLAKLHHPDKNPDDPEATERFKEIQEAYEVLSNEITRHIYDEYRSANKKTPLADRPEKANSKTHQETREVTKEKRIYIYGRILVKFQGDPELFNIYLNQREQSYKITPTETLVTIHSSGILPDGGTKDFQKAYSSADLFTSPLPQPVQCKIITSSGEELYLLTVLDIRIKNPVITNVTKYEQLSFGTLEGDFYGYVVHTYTEEITETFTEYFGPTGRVETREEAGVHFTRQEFYNKDASTQWSEWKVRPSKTTTPKTFHPPERENWGWLFLFLIGLLIWPKVFLALALIFGALFLLALGSSFLQYLPRLLSILSLLSILFFIVLGLGSLFRPLPLLPAKEERLPIDNQKTAINNENQDTLISHLVKWKSYDSVSYSVQLAVLQSAVQRAKTGHERLNGNRLYSNMLLMDTGSLIYVHAAFDSIIRVNNLNDQQSAEMIVSCIQSIPYYLIVDRSCSDRYSDSYINQYLANCQTDCCLGNIRFGVQAPAEFVSDLKGDCDTRALFLYDVLAERGYDVAFLTSDYYKHAVIAVHFRDKDILGGLAMPVDGKNYYLWETTSTGNLPGKMNPAVADLNKWNLNLLHQP